MEYVVAKNQSNARCYFDASNPNVLRLGVHDSANKNDTYQLTITLRSQGDRVVMITGKLHEPFSIKDNHKYMVHTSFFGTRSIRAGTLYSPELGLCVDNDYYSHGDKVKAIYGDMSSLEIVSCVAQFYGDIDIELDIL